MRDGEMRDREMRDREPGRRVDAGVLAGGFALLGSLAVLPVTVARLAGGDDRFPSPLLAAAAPFAAAALVLAVLLALVGRPRRLAIVPGLLAVLHLVWLTPSLLPDGAPARDRGSGITVMTSNVYFGEADGGALVAAVERFEVDVLVVQELTPGMVERLRSAGLERRLRHAVLAAAHGASGTGIWTRVRGEEVAALSGTSFAMPRVRLPLPDGPITVTAAHPYPPHGSGVDQWAADMRVLHDAVAGTTGAQIVAGDFNATRDHAPLRRLLGLGLVDAADAEGVTAWPGMTWPEGRRFPPMLRLDHVLVSERVDVQDLEVLTIPGSDHRTVVARLRLG